RVLGRQMYAATPWLTERHGYDPTLYDGSKPRIKKGIEKQAHIYDCTWRSYWYRSFFRIGVYNS
ncbi:hypothetical protein PTB13_11080, partial [Bacillus sp. MHSD17]|nr:hypothetical protein [Bacillus sp. MHSD17]